MDGLHHRLLCADALQHRVSADASGEFLDAGDAFIGCTSGCRTKNASRQPLGGNSNEVQLGPRRDVTAAVVDGPKVQRLHDLPAEPTDKLALCIRSAARIRLLRFNSPYRITLRSR
jgi:hypothetical protein